ncbi:hypothetical protein QUF72_05485 [Desulfobacterales bacterium HSG2]|nr:hypothetical protein [Desulfobacterales bacterium HSG2]
MKPIYFPFTYVSEPVAEALASCFRQTVIYQPSLRKLPEKMQKRVKNGLFDIRTPVRGDEEKLDAIIKDYRNWAEIHQGSEKAFFKTQGNTIPFFDETSARQIVTDIRQQATGRQQAEPETPDPLLNARIFLCMAHEFDMQNRELEDDLASFDEMEQDLMKNLKGESEIRNLKSEIRNSDDPGIYMTAERINSWVHLMGHDPERSGMFVTSSRSVFEDLTDKAPTTEKIFHFDSIPICESGMDEKFGFWQDSLTERLQMLAESAWPVSAEEISLKAPEDNGCDRSVSLTVCLVPETPDEFFNHYVEHERFQTGEYKNTLLGFVSFKG